MEKSKLFVFDKIIAFALFYLIGTTCLLYSIFSRYFAELNIQFQFLDFPVFIGEIVLMISLALSLMRWRKPKEIRLSSWQVFLFIYIVFMLGKAFLGYQRYGPLALRHAAMFYYPLFALITYSICKKEIFISQIRFFLFMVIFFLLVNFKLHFFTYEYMMLGLVLAGAFKNRIIRYLCFIFVLSVVPYVQLFHGARAMLVASLFSFLSLCLMFLIIVKLSRKIKLLILCLFIFIITLITLQLAPRGAIISLTNPKIFMEDLKTTDKTVRLHRSEFKFIAIRPVLYNPEEKLSVQKNSTRALKISQSEPKANTGNIGKVGDSGLKTSNRPVPTVSQTGNRAPFDAEKRINEASGSQEQAIIQLVTKPKRVIEKTNKKEDLSVTEIKTGTMLFRFYVFLDAVVQLFSEKSILGLPFGRPFRSMRCEIVGSAYGEWSRDGWLSMHDSFLDIIYRTGLIGFILIAVLLFSIARTTGLFLKLKAVKGIILISVIFFWLVVCFFNETLELPYYAIPFWSLFGMIFAYANQLRAKKIS